MKHFNNLTQEEKLDVFYIEPTNFNKDTDKKTLSKSLGALLYMPATKESFAQDVISSKHPSLTAMTLDFEDACGDIEQGQINVFNNLAKIEKAIEVGSLSKDDVPLMFLRMKNVVQFLSMADKIDKLSLLTGFIFPKFTVENAPDYLSTLREINDKSGQKFYGMPILETSEIMYKESRLENLIKIKKYIDEYEDLILNVRLGGTDFSSLYGIRRTIDTTIYDVMVVSDCIKDILNIFNRASDSYVVSGCVWEYFSNTTRMLKPELRETPFLNKENGLEERKEMLSKAEDGLIKEIVLDKLNGIVGKTIIHPTHIKYVNAMQTVTKEEYLDAKMIVENQGVGVLKSTNANKMNEVTPHLNWANKIIEKSKIYGVLNENKSYNCLFK